MDADTQRPRWPKQRPIRGARDPRAAFSCARIAQAFASTETGVAFDITDGLGRFPASLIECGAGIVERRVWGDTMRIPSSRITSRISAKKPVRSPTPTASSIDKDPVELRGDRYHFAEHKDGVINVGGLKGRPEEVEAVINTHPGVQMSLAKARRSPIIGAIVVAEMVLSPATDAARAEASRRLGPKFSNHA
jgi:hypothetical protein